MSVLTAAPVARGTSSKTRVMVVDDSVVVRGLVSRWIAESDEFDVVATANNGRAALDALDRANPDIVLLDLDMPELDGFGALPLLLKQKPHLSVIVVSTLTRRNADISLKCLSLGAVDYLPKPESHREVTTSTGFRQELISKLQGLAASRHARQRAPVASGVRGAVPSVSSALTTRSRKLTTIPRVLLIGSSTGGPRVVGSVLAGLGPAIKKVPVLVVQHMPPIFTAVFAEHLQSQTGAPAHEPKEGEALAPGTIYVAPGGRHMGLGKDGASIVIRLNDGPPVNFCRPAVDVLFKDASSIYGAAALGVILTGMGSDGTHGSKALVDGGACVLAQDEATSTVWGMPGSVAKAGLAHSILPADAIAPAIVQFLSGQLV